MPVTVARLVREVHFVALAWFLAGLSRGVSFVGVSADAREWAEDYDDTASVRVSFSEAVDDEWILVTAIKNFICTGLMVCEGVCILRYCKIFSDENETPSPRRVIVVLASSLCLIGIGLASIPLGCVAVGIAVEASKTLYLMVFTDWVWVYGSFCFARCVLYILDHFDRQSSGQKETHFMKGATDGSSAIVSGSHALFADSLSPVRSSENQTWAPPVSDMRSPETYSASQSQQVSVTTYDLFQKKTKSGAFAMTRPKPARESDFTDTQADFEEDANMPDTHSRKMRLFLNPSRKLASQPGSGFSHSQDNPLFAGAQSWEMQTDAQEKKQAFTKRKQQGQHRTKTGVDVVQADPVGSSKPKASNDDETETWDQHLSFFIETTKQFDQLMDQGFCLTQVALPNESDPNEAVVTPTAHLLIDVATYRWDAPSSRADLENFTSGLSLAVDAPEKSGLPLSFTQAILGLPVDTQATVVTAQAGQRTSGASRPGAIKRKTPETTGRRAVSAHDVDWIIYIVHLRDLIV